MIIKTKWSSGGGKAAKSIANYILKGTKDRQLYYGYRSADREMLKEYVEFAERIRRGKNWASVRHLIIAPERKIEERELKYKVLRVMNEWIKESGNYGIRYVWGMHFNTEHPHAHIAMVSTYSEDLVMEREDLRKIKEIAKSVFGEEIGIRKDKKIEMEMDKELKEAEMEKVEEIEMGA